MLPRVFIRGVQNRALEEPFSHGGRGCSFIRINLSVPIIATVDEDCKHLAAEDGITRGTTSVTLAPLDFTISRAAMPLTGVDPFGEAFFALLAEWQEAGRPYHGLSRAGSE